RLAQVFPEGLNAQVIAERLTERAEHFIFDGRGAARRSIPSDRRLSVCRTEPQALGCFIERGELPVHASPCHGQGEEPSPRHHPGPWAPVIPVRRVPRSPVATRRRAPCRCIIMIVGVPAEVRRGTRRRLPRKFVSRSCAARYR